MMKQDSYPSKVFAAWLRVTFKPLLFKRLPTIVYGGFKHGYIANFIQKHKKAYPYFVKLDIQKFYPSIDHHHLIVETQMAYKALLGLHYVPRKFKQQFLPFIQQFFLEFPLQKQGLPLNSSVSKALAPLLYVPFFLELKKNDQIKFMVYVDDILLLCNSKQVALDTYIKIFNYLKSIELSVNLTKLQQGYFSSSQLTYCGYHFAGGYVAISPEKLAVFKAKIISYCEQNLIVNETVFIKNLNRLINGFGHYYKNAHVKSVYQRLDSFIRARVRKCYLNSLRSKPTNNYLKSVGLRSLFDIKLAKKPIIARLTKKDYAFKEPNKQLKINRLQNEIYIQLLEKMIHQNSEIIGKLNLCVKELVALNKSLMNV